MFYLFAFNFLLIVNKYAEVVPKEYLLLINFLLIVNEYSATVQKECVLGIADCTVLDN